jgi:predicted nucleic acid-binding protein
MADYYLDTSALVKYYIVEMGTDWVRSLVDRRDAGQWVDVVSTSTLTWAEMISAFSRRYRSKGISANWYAALIDRFLTDGRTHYSRLPVNDAIVNQAIELIRRHPLRAYDAVQLATALRLDQVLRDNRLLPVTFVSADGALCDVAKAEGLAAANPNEEE